MMIDYILLRYFLCCVKPQEESTANPSKALHGVTVTVRVASCHDFPYRTDPTKLRAVAPRGKTYYG